MQRFPNEPAVLMAADAAADAIEEPAAEDSTRVLVAGWELFSGASADQDDAATRLKCPAPRCL